jgi:hypothetical protein
VSEWLSGLDALQLEMHHEPLPILPKDSFRGFLVDEREKLWYNAKEAFTRALPMQ